MQKIISAKKIVLFLFVVGFLFVQNAMAQTWVGPTTNPPPDLNSINVDAPINVSNNSQSKASDLTVQKIISSEIKVTAGVPGKKYILTDKTGAGDGDWQPISSILPPFPLWMTNATNGDTLRWNSNPVPPAFPGWEPNNNIFNDPSTNFVGIGTSSPSTNLMINGTTSTNDILSNLGTIKQLNVPTSASIGTTNPPHSSSILDLVSSDKGLLLPRMTDVQMKAIVAPPLGLTVFNTTYNGYYYYDGTKVPPWKSIGAVPILAPGDKNDTLRWSGTEWVKNMILINTGSAVGVGLANPPSASAILDVNSSTLGVLFPRMTTAQRNAIVVPVAQGLTIFNIDPLVNTYEYYDGTKWVTMNNGSAFVNSGNANETLRWDTTSSSWKSSPNIYNDGTSVGIGTITPSASKKLEVVGDSYFNGDVKVGEVGNLLAVPPILPIIKDVTVSGKLTTDKLQVTSGYPFAGQVLTSDNVGNATWQLLKGTMPGGTHGQTLSYDLTINNGTGGWVPNNNIFNDLTTGDVTVTPKTGSTFTVNGTTKLSGDVFQGNGNMAIYGSILPNPPYLFSSSAALEVNSTTQGFLPPRMTTVQKLAITSPTNGLTVFDTTLGSYQYWDGPTSKWLPIGTVPPPNIVQPGNNSDETLRWDSVAGNWVPNTSLLSNGVGHLTVSGSEVKSNGKNSSITIENTGTLGGAWTLRSGALGTNTAPGGFSIADNNNNYRFAIGATGNVGINTTTPDVSAALDINSIDGGLLPPIMSDAQKLAIVTPAKGLIIFNSDVNKNTYEYNAGTPAVPNWTPINGGGAVINKGNKLGNTLYWDGLTWVANSLLYNNGVSIGINTTPSTTNKLEVVGNTNLNGDVVVGDSSFSSGPKTLSVIGNVLVGTNTFTPIPQSNPPTPHALEVGNNGSALIPNIFSNFVDSNNVVANTNLCLGLPGPTQCIQSWSQVSPPLNQLLPTGGVTGNTLHYDSSVAGGGAWIKDSNIFNDGSNVGIGTSTPSSKLDVNGSLSVSSSTSWADIVLNSKGGLNSPAIYVGGPNNATVPDLDLRISSKGLGNLIINEGNPITGGGAVGIGPNVGTLIKPEIVTDPNLKLYVNGNTKMNGDLVVWNNLYAFDVSANKIKTISDITTPSLCLGTDPCISSWSSISPASNLLLPTGATSGDTLRYNGTKWTNNNNIFNDGTNVGIGRASGWSIKGNPANPGGQGIPYLLQIGDTVLNNGSLYIAGDSASSIPTVVQDGSSLIYGNMYITGLTELTRVNIGNATADWKSKLAVNGNLEVVNGDIFGGNGSIDILKNGDVNVEVGNINVEKKDINIDLGNIYVSQGKIRASTSLANNWASGKATVCADSLGTLMLCDKNTGDTTFTYSSTGVTFIYPGEDYEHITFVICGAGGSGAGGWSDEGHGGGGGGGGACEKQTFTSYKKGSKFTINLGAGGKYPSQSTPLAGVAGSPSTVVDFSGKTILTAAAGLGGSKDYNAGDPGGASSFGANGGTGSGVLNSTNEDGGGGGGGGGVAVYNPKAPNGIFTPAVDGGVNTGTTLMIGGIGGGGCGGDGGDGGDDSGGGDNDDIGKGGKLGGPGCGGGGGGGGASWETGNIGGHGGDGFGYVYWW